MHHLLTTVKRSHLELKTLKTCQFHFNFDSGDFFFSQQNFDLFSIVYSAEREEEQIERMDWFQLRRD